MQKDWKSRLSEKRCTTTKRRSDESIAREVEGLLVRMNLHDKVGQMSQVGASEFAFGAEREGMPVAKLVREGRVGSILGAFDCRTVFELQTLAVEESELRIPLFFNADVIHGHETVFPVPLAWSCSWDMDAIKAACSIAAREASAAGLTYNHGPMVDISRDPRWGRVVEGAGEDPYLGAQIARAQIDGFQGADLFDRETIIACLKHFIAYGAVEGGRDYNTVDVSEMTLRDVYLPPFEEGLKAGAASVMNAFTVYEGIPLAGNRRLLNDLLRDELGFEGMLISDYGSVEELIAHGHAPDECTAARLAVEATIDIEMVSRIYAARLPQLVESGLVSEEQIDAAVRRILTHKYKIGIMDDPFRYIRPDDMIKYHYCSAHRAESRRLARKSIVLLKNNGLLPIDTKTQVALIGPFADSKDLLGPWQFSHYHEKTVTIEEGIRSKLSTDADLLVSAGAGVTEPLEGGIDDAIAKAVRADIVILALGETSEMSGEAASRTELSLPGAQMTLAREVVALGKPTLLVLVNGRPLILQWFEENTDAIVESWFLGSQAGHAIADVLYGDCNPSGKLTMSFPRSAGQIPIYYNHFRTGRPKTEEKFTSKYLDSPNSPLYPFGHGLSYTTFAYSEVWLDKRVFTERERIRATVTVTNTGERAGDEVVQLYVQDLYGSRVRPVKQLRGFKRVSLQPKESREVTFAIGEEELRFYTCDAARRAEPGEFKLYIGSSSESVREAQFQLVRTVADG